MTSPIPQRRRSRLERDRKCEPQTDRLLNRPSASGVSRHVSPPRWKASSRFEVRAEQDAFGTRRAHVVAREDLHLGPMNIFLGH
jgi:hypothetical protein